MKKFIKLFSLAAISAVSSMLLFGVNGQAYLDPSVMTYAIQVVAGLVVAVSAIAGIYLRKAKKLISERFGIDENRNKIFESDDIEIYDEE